MTLIYDLLILAGVRIAAPRLLELAGRIATFIAPVVQRSIKYLWPIVEAIAVLLVQVKGGGRNPDAWSILTSRVKSMDTGRREPAIA